MGIKMQRLKKPVEERAGKTRREFLKQGGALAALAFGGSLLWSSMALADGSRENSRYKRVSLEDMQRWDRETKPFRHATDTLDKEAFTTSVKLRFSNTEIVVAGVVNYRKKNNSAIGIRFKKDSESRYHEFEIDFQILAKLYQAKTGNELKSLRLIVEKGADPQVGEYIQIWAIPNGEIKAGVPALPAFAYYQGKLGKSHKPLLLASAK
jgi:hypothetical protein